MKGSMEGMLPMLALFIMSIAMATQSIPLTEALGDIVGSSTDDIERVVDTRAYTDFYFYNYVPLAAEYAVNDASYELGNDAGGEDWNNEWLDENSFSNIYVNWFERSTENLNEAIDGSEGACEIPDLDYTVTPFDDTQADDTKLGVNAGPEPGENTPLTATCPSSEGETRYLSEDSTYSTTTEAVNNRYTNLAMESVDAFQDIQTELDDLSDWSTTGTASNCGDSQQAEEDAEEDAKNDLENAVEAAISTGLEDIPERNYIDVELWPDENYSVGDANWDHIEGNVKRDGSTGIDDTSDCNCDADGNNCDTRYSAEADASPDKVNMDWLIEDSEFEIIVEGDYQTLVFDVSGNNHYTYEW